MNRVVISVAQRADALLVPADVNTLRRATRDLRDLRDRAAMVPLREVDDATYWALVDEFDRDLERLAKGIGAPLSYELTRDV